MCGKAGLWPACMMALAAFVGTRVGAAADPARGPKGPPAWRAFRGEGDSGSTTEGDMELIHSAPPPAALKPLWTSEEQGIPYGWRHPNGFKNTGITGGYGGPVVAGGRVYIVWWEPSGPVCRLAVRSAKDKRPEKWRVAADEVICAMDAATGKTLWKARMQRTGLNDQFGNHCKNYTPAVADGAVCVSGNGGWLYCLEARDGSLRWKAKVGSIADTINAWQEAGFVMGDGRYEKDWKEVYRNLAKVHTMAFNSNPVISAGVVASSDFSGPERRGLGRVHGLIGFDLRTGKERWRVPECIASVSSPALWRYQGREYIIAAGPTRAVCITPATGDILWEILPPAEDAWPVKDDEEENDPRGRHGSPKLMVNGTPAVSGNYLVLSGTYGPTHGSAYSPAPWMSGPRCWKMTADGARQIWRLPRAPREFRTDFASFTIYRGHVYILTRGGSTCVSLDTGQVLGKTQGEAFVSAHAGDGRLFVENRMYLAHPDAFGARGPIRLPIPHERYTQSFYADGFLFVRGQAPGHTHDDAPTSHGAVFCYDLRK